MKRHAFGDLKREGHYDPLHEELFVSSPDAYDPWSSRHWLHPDFKAAAEARDTRALLKEECPGVFSFPLFSTELCAMLLEEVAHAQRSCEDQLARPNGMNRYGLVLNQLGLEPMIWALLSRYLAPVMAELYGEEGSELDDHHTFIVRYSGDEDVGLDMHEDDSDVTLNVCLGKDFVGSGLTFCGMKNAAEHRRVSHVYRHEPGRAVVHLGRHRHGADDIQGGERINFILWATSSKYRASEDYQARRKAAAQVDPPDKVCMSYTHDADYAHVMQGVLPRAEAERRGVMLHQVELRAKAKRAVVHNLAAPIAEINTSPALCVFMEGAERGAQQQAAQALMAVAAESEEEIFCFAATSSSGAVSQVKSLLAKGLPSTNEPAYVLLDVQGGVYYAGEGAVSTESLRALVGKFKGGGLSSSPLGE